MNNEIEYYENKLNEIDDEIDDVIENFKYLLIHVEIENINILSFYNSITNLLINKEYIKNKLFNLKN